MSLGTRLVSYASAVSTRKSEEREMYAAVVVKEGFLGEAARKLRPQMGAGASQVTGGKSAPGRENGMCKGPKAGRKQVLSSHCETKAVCLGPGGGSSSPPPSLPQCICWVLPWSVPPCSQQHLDSDSPSRCILQLLALSVAHLLLSLHVSQEAQCLAARPQGVTASIPGKPDWDGLGTTPGPRA